MWRYIQKISILILLANMNLMAQHASHKCVALWHDHVSTDCARHRICTVIDSFFAQQDTSLLTDTTQKELSAYYHALQHALKHPVHAIEKTEPLFIRYKKIESLYMQEYPEAHDAISMLASAYSITISTLYGHILCEKIKTYLAMIMQTKGYWGKQQDALCMHILTRAPYLWRNKKSPGNYLQEYIEECQKLYETYSAYLGAIMHHMYSFNEGNSLKDWQCWIQSWMQKEKDILSQLPHENNAFLYKAYQHNQTKWRQKMHNEIKPYAIPHHIERYWYVYTAGGSGLLWLWYKNSSHKGMQRRMGMLQQKVIESIHDPVEAVWEGVAQDVVTLDSIRAQQQNIDKERDHHVEQVMTYLKQRNPSLSNEPLIIQRLKRGDLLDLGKDYNEIVGSRWGFLSGALSTDVFRNLGLQVGGLKIWLMDKIYGIYEHVHKNAGPNKLALALARSLPIYAAASGLYYLTKAIVSWNSVPTYGRSISCTLKRIHLYLSDRSYIANQDLYRRCGDYICCMMQLEKQIQACDKSLKTDILQDYTSLVSCNVPREQKVIFADSLCLCANFF